jgi:hypothetical protein
VSMLDDLYNGINPELEEQANSILREGRRGVTALSEKKDYLTEEQLNLRQAREVLNSNGFPDPSIRQGLYRRTYSPLAGNRPGRRPSDDM